MSAELKARIAAGMGVLILSTWTAARLVSRYDPHWGIALLWGAVTGAIVGAALGNVSGCIASTALGVVVALVLIPFDVTLWVVFTLPPHPKTDF
jgi:hypothetical protein